MASRVGLQGLAGQGVSWVGSKLGRATGGLAGQGYRG